MAPKRFRDFTIKELCNIIKRLYDKEIKTFDANTTKEIEKMYIEVTKACGKNDPTILLKVVRLHQILSKKPKPYQQITLDTLNAEYLRHTLQDIKNKDQKMYKSFAKMDLDDMNVEKLANLYFLLTYGWKIPSSAKDIKILYKYRTDYGLDTADYKNSDIGKKLKYLVNNVYSVSELNNEIKDLFANMNDEAFNKYVSDIQKFGEHYRKFREKKRLSGDQFGKIDYNHIEETLKSLTPEIAKALMYDSSQFSKYRKLHEKLAAASAKYDKVKDKCRSAAGDDKCAVVKDIYKTAIDSVKNIPVDDLDKIDSKLKTFDMLVNDYSKAVDTLNKELDKDNKEDNNRDVKHGDGRDVKGDKKDEKGDNKPDIKKLPIAIESEKELLEMLKKQGPEATEFARAAINCLGIKDLIV
jgi:hypothetical protein